MHSFLAFRFNYLYSAFLGVWSPSVRKTWLRNQDKSNWWQLEEHSLGVSTYDYDWTINNVNFVFHCAATIRFNETLQTAIKINIQGTENLLELSTRIINFKYLI